MKNKFNYFIILISTFLLFSFGCSEEFLEEKALTFYTEDNFYTTPEAMDLGVVHFYSDAMNNLELI